MPVLENIEPRRDPLADTRTAFLLWLEKRPEWWERFTSRDFQVIANKGTSAGEYVNPRLQQLWECWRDAQAALRQEEKIAREERFAEQWS